MFWLFPTYRSVYMARVLRKVLAMLQGLSLKHHGLEIHSETTKKGALNSTRADQAWGYQFDYKTRKQSKASMLPLKLVKDTPKKVGFLWFAIEYLIKGVHPLLGRVAASPKTWLLL